MNATKIELYVGTGDDHLGDIRPAQGPLDPAVYWRRDRSRPDLDVQMAKDGDTVLFPFEPGGSADALAAFVVVGYGANDQPVGVATQLVWTDIPDDRIFHYDLVLGGFQPAPSDPENPLPGLQVWGPEGDAHACVQVDNIDELGEYADANGIHPRSGMIVLQNDRDCDGYKVPKNPSDPADPDLPNRECVDNEYMAVSPFGHDELVCATTTEFSGVATGTGCVVGGETCVDGEGPDMVSGVCTRSNYCTSTIACGCATPGYCDPFPTTPAQAGRLLLVCSLATDAQAPGQFCEQGVAHLDLSALLRLYGVSCDPQLDLGAKLRVTAVDGFQNPFPLSTTATITITRSADSPCAFDITATGPVPPGSGGGNLSELTAWIAVPLTGPSAGRGLILPINFSIGTGSTACGTGVTTTVNCTTYPTSPPDDAGLSACLKAAPDGVDVSD